MNAKDLVIRTAGLVNERLNKTHWPLFFTLTYRDPGEWESKQISRFIDNYRVFVRRNGYPDEKLVYLWVTEKNPNREGVHYHGVIWIRKGLRPPKPDNQGWWKYGWTNVQKARSPAGYLAKYLFKSQHNFGVRCRRYAIQVKSILCIDYLRLPSWAAYHCQFGDIVKRVKGYGWVNFTRKTYHQSPFRFSKAFGCNWLGWDDGGYPCMPKWKAKLTEWDEWHILIGEYPYADLTVAGRRKLYA